MHADLKRHAAELIGTFILVVIVLPYLAAQCIGAVAASVRSRRLDRSDTPPRQAIVPRCRSNASVKRCVWRRRQTRGDLSQELTGVVFHRGVVTPGESGRTELEPSFGVGEQDLGRRVGIELR